MTYARVIGLMNILEDQNILCNLCSKSITFQEETIMIVLRSIKCLVKNHKVLSFQLKTFCVYQGPNRKKMEHATG